MGICKFLYLRNNVNVDTIWNEIIHYLIIQSQLNLDKIFQKSTVTALHWGALEGHNYINGTMYNDRCEW